MEQFDIKDFYPMFREYNSLYGYRLPYENEKRTELLRRASKNATVAEITECVIRNGNEMFIDSVLAKIAEDPMFIVGQKAYYAKEMKPMKNTNNSNNLGMELQNALLATVAQFTAEKLTAEVMPSVRQKVVEEFGMLPVKHEIKVGESAPVTVDGELPPCFDDILGCVANGVNVMMTGHAGTGKGYMARQVAKALEADFFEVNAVDTEYGLTGFVDANSRYNSTPFYDACKASAEGKKVIFLFDEMDCSNSRALKVFNEALEAKEFTFPNDEKLEFENMVVMSACNTYGTGSDEMYTGNRIDESTLNRFVMIKVDYNRKIEEKLAEGDEDLCDFVDAFRNQIDKCGLQTVVSYRNIKQITKLKKVLPLKKVMQMALIKSMAEDDLSNIMNNLSDVMSGNVYYRATKGENVKVA